MRTTIYKTLLIAFTSAFAASASSQEAPQREQQTVEAMAADQTESMSSRLALTPEQTERIMAINLDFFAKKKEAKDRLAPEAEFILLYQKRNDAVESVLTTAQFTTWKKDPLEEKRRERQERESNSKNESKNK